MHTLGTTLMTTQTDFPHVTLDLKQTKKQKRGKY